MNKPLVIAVIAIGVLLLICSAIYFIEPAKSLPAFFPGHDVSLAKHHYKHGIGALILGAGCFVFAWFQSGKKSAKKE